ncbi:hypothetical protein [Rhizobium lentis]|uniref:hypothetical protein n=1 Tax=Rhizobium lentis TaxID=1138194 RepID=UPI001C83985A|nr:hypothetical protein [Rhizobium lentis]MBX5034242.1 hypothetical protein [Rhizobium lentis]
MNRYMIYLPGNGDWMEIVVSLQQYGNTQTDQRHLVTLTSDSDIVEIDTTLRKSHKVFLLAKVAGSVGFHAVSAEMIAAADLIREPI